MASRYLEPEIERRSSAAMTRWQAGRLREQGRRANAHSPFYRRTFKARSTSSRSSSGPHEGLDDILVRVAPSPALARAERDGLGGARREPAHGAGAASQRGGHRTRRAPALGPQGPAREGRAHRGVVL